MNYSLRVQFSIMNPDPVNSRTNQCLFAAALHNLNTGQASQCAESDIRVQ
jgi:hypothetical protein